MNSQREMGQGGSSTAGLKVDAQQKPAVVVRWCGKEGTGCAGRWESGCLDAFVTCDGAMSCTWYLPEGGQTRGVSAH